MSERLLDRSLVGPENDEYQRIERAVQAASTGLNAEGMRRGLKLQWSYGDSGHWLVIFSAPKSADVASLLASSDAERLAEAVSVELRRVLQLRPDFRLDVDLDSDERVSRAEGWFYRLQAEGGPAEWTRSYVFADGVASRAAD